MSSKPILFSTEMVKALLEGRKTQTRRVMRHQPIDLDTGALMDRGRIHWPETYTTAIIDRNGMLIEGPEAFGCYDEDGNWGCKAPYQPGDILWVRETWMKETEQGVPTGAYIYKATDRPEPDLDSRIKWRSPYHMPREAARIFLRVTDVRAEPVQDISGSDAVSEGVSFEPIIGYKGRLENHDIALAYNTALNMRAKTAFLELWDKLHAKRYGGIYARGQNPWVWVITFERIADPTL